MDTSEVIGINIRLDFVLVMLRGEHRPRGSTLASVWFRKLCRVASMPYPGGVLFVPSRCRWR